jgi:hypothetical protein
MKRLLRLACRAQALLDEGRFSLLPRIRRRLARARKALR